jgi:hypothetical protein
LEVHSAWSHIASPGVVHANTPKIRGRGDGTALPYRTGQYRNAMELSQAPAVSSRYKTARSDSERRATGRVRTRCRLRAMLAADWAWANRKARAAATAAGLCGPCKGGRVGHGPTSTVGHCQWRAARASSWPRHVWAVGRGQTPKIPESRPSRLGFGRKNSRDFPDPDWAGIGGTLGIFPRFPIWPGFREIGESRNCRGRENSRDLRLD